MTYSVNGVDGSPSHGDAASKRRHEALAPHMEMLLPSGVTPTNESFAGSLTVAYRCDAKRWHRRRGCPFPGALEACVLADSKLKISVFLKIISNLVNGYRSVLITYLFEI